jgi:endo-1,4-beta-D-glucanase Y
MELLIDKLNLAPKLWGEQHRTKFNLDKLKRLLKETGFTTETTGTLNIISPLVAFFNPNFADKLSFIEFKSLPLGNLLYCVAIKDK